VGGVRCGLLPIFLGLTVSHEAAVYSLQFGLPWLKLGWRLGHGEPRGHEVSGLRVSLYRPIREAHLTATAPGHRIGKEEDVNASVREAYFGV